MSRPMWVTFSADGFPIGFAVAQYFTGEEVAAKYPANYRTDLVTDPDEIGRLLDRHRGKS